MRKKLDNGNRFYELKEGGLTITPDNRCIINYVGRNYHQFIWDGDQTSGVSVPVLKHILLKKYDELEKFISTFDYI